MLGILSNIIELTNRRPQGKTLKTHYKVFIKLVFGVTSQWPTYCSYTVFEEGTLRLPRNFYWNSQENHMLLYLSTISNDHPVEPFLGLIVPYTYA